MVYISRAIYKNNGYNVHNVTIHKQVIKEQPKKDEPIDIIGQGLSKIIVSGPKVENIIIPKNIFKLDFNNVKPKKNIKLILK